MALAPRLEFRQTQQLVMTPQLQQAIKLLQMSNLELTEYVESQLEENPFLERGADEVEAPGSEAGQNAAAEAPQNSDNRSDNSIDLSKDETASAAREALDTGYESDYQSSEEAPAGDFKVNEWASVGAGKAAGPDDRELGATYVKEISLREHLSAQLHVATRDPQQLFIGAYLIDMINDAGYLQESIEAVAERLGTEPCDVDATLRLIQTFDPCGAGARDLKECLRLQLLERDRFDPTMQAFIENLELLAKGDLKGLMKVTGASADDVRDMIGEVRSLTPKPGYAFGGETIQVVTPDVFVRPAPDGGWIVELNNETMPRVLVNQRYYAEISKAGGNEKDKTFVNDHFANANWLAKSLDQRAKTILKVAKEIVRQQDSFLVYGVKHLRPLNLRTVADAISMHESTVSRVTSNKYIATPRGLFELKYFFTAAIASSEGGEAHSAESVRQRIRELINEEKPDAILSDDKIVEILRAEGVEIARRTVAKYRETLNIPSSVERRRHVTREAI